jgi:hypothetical protein
MKLYEATNGYMGESYVRCLVIAPDDETAMRLAQERFSEPQLRNRESQKRESWMKNIALEILCDDTSKEWSNEVGDG